MNSDVVRRNINELHKNLGWYVALSIGMIILGVFAIIAPFVATIAVERLAGIAFGIGGIILVVHAFRWRTTARFITNLLLGIVYFLFGLYLLAYPVTGIFALTVALAVFFLLTGIYKIVTSIRMRPASSWGWVLFSGIVSVVLSALIWIGLPLTALWVVGLLVGIDLLFSGWSLFMIMMSVRNAYKKHEVFCIGADCYAF